MCTVEAMEQRHEAVIEIVDKVLDISGEHKGLCPEGSQVEFPLWTTVISGLSALLTTIISRQLEHADPDMDKDQIHETAQDLTRKIMRAKMQERLRARGIEPVMPGVFMIDLGKVDFGDLLDFLDE